MSWESQGWALGTSVHRHRDKQNVGKPRGMSSLRTKAEVREGARTESVKDIVLICITVL